jgi:ubiquinone/menaquinone biosynthesis C-methylase UbiE
MMPPRTKTDNHSPRVKLDLRRYFLKRYHAAGEPIRVMDCCQGSGVLWGQLRKEFDVAGYWGLDIKPKVLTQLKQNRN